MDDETQDDGLRARLTRQSEDAIGKLAGDLLENPLVNAAITRAFDAREKASQAQEVAMGALNIPSAADLERLTRRLRSVSQRLEGIEDGVDRLDERLGTLGSSAKIEDRLRGIEERLEAIAGELSRLGDAVADIEPMPREQERLKVGENSRGPAAAGRRRAAARGRGVATAGGRHGLVRRRGGPATSRGGDVLRVDSIGLGRGRVSGRGG